MFLWHSLLCVQPSRSFAILLALNLGQSFLGMNIIESSTPFSTNHNTTSSSSSSSAACSDSTSVSCSQGVPNPHLWNMSTFGILSGSILLVTLVVPVTLDPITRWFLRSWFPHLIFLLQVATMLTLVTVIAYFRESF